MKMWSSWTSWKTWRSVLVFCVAGWLIYIAAMNLMVVYFAKELTDRSPAVKLMPTPLPDSKLADLATGTTISRFGYTIHVPWSSPLKKLDLETASNFSTSDGSIMWFFDPASHVDAREMYKDDPLMESILGHREMSSGYQLFQAAMLSSPEQVRWWRSRTFNVRAMVLINLKEMFVLDGTTEVHPISGQHVHGYEALGIHEGRRTVHLELFDDRGRDLELMLSWFPGKASALTQAQINAMVASIQIPEGGCTTPGECS